MAVRTVTERPHTTTLTPSAAAGVVDRALEKGASVLSRYSVHLLRISLGLVFLGFGALKFFPGASPAEELAVATIDKMTFGIVGGSTALLLTAAIETVIGLTLLTGRFLRAGLVVMAGAMVGIMSPLVLFFGELFPGGLPTIEGQYVLKDIILVAAATVVVAHALGARMVPMRQARR